MNRLTITIEFSDSIEFSASKIETLEKGFREACKEVTKDKDIERFDVFHETKKRYHF